MLRAHLVDGHGTSARQHVSPVGAALFEEHPIPPYGGTQHMRAYRAFLLLNGTGTNDMQVAASASSPSDFYVEAHPTRDRYISLLSFLIADGAAQLNQFGAITALTNGCRLFYTDEFGDVDIHTALQSNFDFIRLCVGEPAFTGGTSGGGTADFRALNVSGTSEGYLPTLDIKRTFGFRWGIRITHGTKQRLTMRVQDDTTGVDAFNCIAYGFERLPD